MKLEEKIDYFKNNHKEVWLQTYWKVFEELSDKQSLTCCCGKLATGLHERSCKKFNLKVAKETAKRLKYLEDKPKEIKTSKSWKLDTKL